MKTTLYFVLIFCILPTSGFSQYSSIERRVIDRTEVPEAVIKSQRNQFPDGFVTQWKIHTRDVSVDQDITYYMATFKKDGRLGNYSYYSPAGKLYAYSIFISAFDLPEYIRNQINNEMSGWFIKAAEMIDLEDPHRYIYRVRLNNNGQLRYLYFDGNGEPISKNKLPANIFAFL